MISFLHDLVKTGRVVVPLAPSDEAAVPAELEAAIRELDAAERLELPHTPPRLSIATAAWALSFIEKACRFLVYREFDAETIAAATSVAGPAVLPSSVGTATFGSEALEASCPAASPAERAYSADLFLRYLPDITRLARGVGERDPLVDQLQRMAEHWPLSSVGMSGVTCAPDDLDPILSNPSLCRLYVDRIIERSDTTRLQPPTVREAVRVALGAYPSLAPAISEAMKGIEEQT